jgi:hypothetical protein
MILRAKATCMVVMLVAHAAGCSNSSGTLGKGKLDILNVVSLEGEGISWDNRVPPQPAAGMPGE